MQERLGIAKALSQLPAEVPHQNGQFLEA